MKTLGEFYKENVLTRKDLIEKELPSGSGDIRIEKDLFGWKVYSGKEAIECRSEDEAKFIYVFLDAGMTELKIPRDDKYLSNILPELEKLKKRIDEIIDHYACGIISPRLREQLKHKVYAEITQ